MNRRLIPRGARVAVCAVAIACALPAGAQAEDESPCAKDTTVSWTKERVQLCPLSSPLADGSIPVYKPPVGKRPGAAVPRPTAGVLHGSARYFVCDTKFPKAIYHHPSGWWNNWWALTRSESGKWGWVPEVFFKGGDNGEADSGLRTCPPPRPPPAPPPPPPPIPPCELSAPASGYHVQARFRNSGRVATVAFGRELQVTGRVETPDGSPAGGATLCVGVQGVGGPVRATGMVTADAEGRFDYKLGRGASRRVWFVHQVDRAIAAASVTARVRAPVAVKAAPRVLRNGESVVLSGRLRGRPRGVLVELQYARGGRWLNFATTRVRRGKRYRFTYRFTRTFSPRSYRFRARVPAQRGYPFATGASRPVSVRVSG